MDTMTPPHDPVEDCDCHACAIYFRDKYRVRYITSFLAGRASWQMDSQRRTDEDVRRLAELTEAHARENAMFTDALTEAEDEISRLTADNIKLRFQIGSIR